MENYHKICENLCKTLQETRQYDDLLELQHLGHGDGRRVYAVYKNGSIRVINVALDSGIAMIKDILKNL